MLTDRLVIFADKVKQAPFSATWVVEIGHVSVKQIIEKG